MIDTKYRFNQCNIRIFRARFSRFLNNAEIAPFIPGANYTFFVPNDDAFKRHGFNRLNEEGLANDKTNKFLLNHFIKGRLYDRNLKHDEVFESIGGSPLKIQRLPNGELLISIAKLSSIREQKL